MRGELPLEVRDLEDELEGLHIRIEKIEQDIKDYQNALPRRRVTSLTLKQVWSVTTKQLDSVANNQ